MAESGYYRADEREDELYDEGGGRGPRSRRPDGAGGGRFGGSGFRPRRAVCSFCVDRVQHIDYKDVKVLESYIDTYGKIRAARKTGACAKHQRRLAVAIKRARHLALLPFSTARRRGDY
jgi:small subunit ribosomal protein S18